MKYDSMKKISEHLEGWLPFKTKDSMAMDLFKKSTQLFLKIWFE